MSNIIPPANPEETPATSAHPDLSGSGDPHDETGPPGVDLLSVRAGHEPDRFQVGPILYVPALTALALLLAYLVVTGIFQVVNIPPTRDVPGGNAQVVQLNEAPINERFARTSSDQPQPLPGLPNTGVPQPRLEGLRKTHNKGPDDPPYYRSKLPLGVDNPPYYRPEDLRPENYIDPVSRTKILAEYSWMQPGKVGRIPIGEAIRLATDKTNKGFALPVRQNPVKLLKTESKASLSNSGHGGLAGRDRTAPKKDGKENKDNKKAGH